MRRVLMLTLVCAACGDSTPDPDGGGAGLIELQLEVTVRTDLVVLNAYEVDRAFNCNQKIWLDQGSCDMTSDAFSCDGEPPAGCITALRVEEGGTLVDSGPYDPYFQDGYLEVPGAATRDLELIVEGCGGEARVPIAATTPPAPALGAIVDDGTNIQISWTGDAAAASGVVGWSGGFGGPRCHVAAGEPATLESPGANPEYLLVFVTAYTAPVEHTTGLGVARVRTAGTVSQEQ